MDELETERGTSPEQAPAISVVIPVHNRAGLLAAALGSVVSQSIRLPVETVVVDDCSSDDSASVGRALGARVLRLDRNLGPGMARNQGIAQARGEWIAFLDSDDLWAPSHLEVLWGARHGVAMVASSGLTVHPLGARVYGSPFLRPVELRRPADLLRPENIVNTSACMVRADALRATGGFAPSGLSEDLDLWMRIVASHRARVLATLTVANRPHPGQTSRLQGSVMAKSASEVLEAAVSASLVDALCAARLESTMRWDSFRASGAAWYRVAAYLSGTDLSRLALLWLRRASMRHRWRLAPLRSRQLRTLMSKGAALSP